MVQLKEFRIVMPMSLEEYQVAQAFMVMKMQQQTTTSTEGVDILESREFQDDILGVGYYTSKVYRLQRKRRGMLIQDVKQVLFRSVSLLKKSTNYDFQHDRTKFILRHLNWEPRRTVIKCPYFNKFSLTIDTIHKADNGKSENVHCLSQQQLAARQVELIDIATAATNYWSYVVGSNNVNFSDFKSLKTGRGPLCEGWQEKCSPVMTAYKVVTIEAPYWGFGSRVEQVFLAGERALFIESHKNCFAWIDEWFGMTMEQICELEQQSQSSVDEVTLFQIPKAGKPPSLSGDKDDKDKPSECVNEVNH